LRFELIRHDVVDSTSERAFAAIAAKTARHGDVHLARAQTRGRGRFGRTWHSAPDEGLYMSVVLLPPPPPWNPSALTMAAGLALFDTAERLGLQSCALKWPNDLLIDGAKLAGVLVETRGLDPERPHYVAGIGLNVKQSAFPPALSAERHVTSLSSIGLSISIEDAAASVLAALADRLDHVINRREVIAADYLRASRLTDAPITVSVGALQHSGSVVGLSLDEGLLLRDDASRRDTLIPLEFVREIRLA
jgi:BirA family biotin operon repressor/biotin-[acetyl-CoA-carboxylase] ligase